MAMDIRITSGYRIQMGYLFPKQLLAIFQIVIVLTQSLASPVWMPQFLSAGQGRNIRHLPCVSRRTGEQGICMFAYTCMKSNGTHLGTCIDRFYFGSCCRIEDNNDLLLDNHLNFPVINNNQVSSPFYPDDGKIESIGTTSVQNNFNQFTSSHASTNINYPIKTSTAKTDTSTLTSGVSAFDNGAHYTSSVMNLAQHLATGMDTNTEKVYVPVFTSLKPNKTDGDLKKPPVTQNQIPVVTTATPPTTTLQYFLSTFQVVHSEGDTTTQAPTTQTTKRITTSTTAKPTTKPTTILTTQHKKNQTITTKPIPQSTTTKKPSKPSKPYTTTRKPPTKKPPTKPVIKTTTAKPVQKVTTAKPVAPTKKPIPPTKKPVTTAKPTTAKSTTTAKPTTTTKPTTKPSIGTTRKPITTTTQSTFSTLFPLETTSEVIFTKPGGTQATFSTPTTLFGITTFRPDLTPTTNKPILITGPGLTTFSYVSEGIKDTTLKPETTTSRFQTTSSKPSSSSSSSPTTISNEISSSEIIGAISEVQEENTNVIFQQAGSTDFSSPTSSAQTPLVVNLTTTDTSSVRPANTTIPFFPETSGPSEPTKTPWIEIVQGSSTSEEAMTVNGTTTITTVPTTHVPIFTGLNHSDYTQICGRRIYPEARVVGGEKSTFGKWPWQISLRQWRTSTYLHKCGAALLNENWAITAAHCVENVPPSDLLLRLGEHDLSTEDEPYGFQERRVQIVASHPQFDPRTFEYDLALLRFYEPVKFQPNIIPVCVPEDSTNFVGQTAYVTGWGRLYEDGPLPSVLQEVSVPVINNTLCENMYRAAGYIEHIPEIFICAGWKKGGFDSCEGDSGGPMVIQRPDKRWLLAGVISWGIGCAEPNQPGVYTRISEFREWIHQILQF